MMSSPSSSQADSLKAEGNALFGKGDLAGAYEKYTEALKHDDKNAILYSNRAACCLGLNRHLDASSDATKAMNIDPGYAKAWAHLGEAKTGLGNLDRAVDAWKRALGVLPIENVTAAQQKQREQYSYKLEAAEAKSKSRNTNPRQPEGAVEIPRSDLGSLPWERAKLMIPDLMASQTWDSSAWVIERAYSTWEEGIKGMKEGHEQQTPSGPAYIGRLGVIAEFTNALIEDSRVFHIGTNDTLMATYNKQVHLELSMTKDWSNCGSREVMQEAPKLLNAEGWESVRPALSLTVRCWVMRGWFEEALGDEVATALEFYNSAMEILKWGAERWRDVPFEEKGAIFQPTFIRGIKCLRLDLLLKGCNQDPIKFPYEELIASADELIAELVGAPTLPHVPDPAFFLSFFRYPVGKARSSRGFCFLNKAKNALKVNGGVFTEDITKQYLNASVEYLKAATSYPKDDENHAWFLHCAYRAQFEGGSTPKFLMLILDRLKESVPLMKRIWGVTPQAVGGRDRALDEDLQAREQFQRAIDAGPLELDTFVRDGQSGVFLKVF